MPQSVYSRLGTSLIQSPNQVARQHTVTGDEDLTMIAWKEYPDLGYRADTWRNIATTNGIADLDALAAGAVLTIPAPPVSST